MAEEREFKVHDRVALNHSAHYGMTRIGSVVRLTKTQVIVQFPGVRVESRYRRDDGYEVGSSSQWGRARIRHATDKDFQDIAWQNLKSLAGRLDKIAEEHGRKDAVLQLQIMADKFITHINETEDQK